MSSALTKAIDARLVGKETMTGIYADAQATLKTLLAEDPDTLVDGETGTGLPAIFKANLNDVALYDCITYRESGGIIDRRFTHGMTSVGLVAVDKPIYDFEIWSKSSGGSTLSDIDDAFKLLLDQRYGAPPLSIPNGLVDCALTFVMPTMLYDKDRNAWFLLRRIQFKERFVQLPQP